MKLQAAGVEATAKAAGYGHLGDANLHLNVTSLSGRDDQAVASKVIVFDVNLGLFFCKHFGIKKP